MGKSVRFTKEQTRELLEALKGGFEYSEENEIGLGVFKVKVTTSSRRVTGAWAGCTHKYSGYRQLWLCGRLWQEHRLVWLWHYGYLPDEIDHIKGCRSDNRVGSLRIATTSQNNAAKTPGRPRGVTKLKRTLRKPWVARITVKNKHIALGYYATKEAAYEAYNEAAKEYFGEFASLNDTPCSTVQGAAQVRNED